MTHCPDVICVRSYSGTIPPSMCTLPFMQNMEFHNNLFTGSLPECIGQMSRMKYLRLDHNFFDGAIPTSIGDMHDLIHINLDDNEFTSTIPSSLGNLPELIYLYLSANSLTGEIPAELARLRSTIQDLDFGDNILVGTIPSSLCELTKLNTLSVRFNNIVGRIPSSLSDLTQLRILLLNGNYFSGSLNTLFSAEVNMTKLQVFDASNNALTGQLPRHLFEKLPQVSTVALSLNCMTGSLPVEVCSAETLAVLSLDGLGSSKDCAGYGSLFVDLFSSQGLTGSIPECLLALPTLGLLHLSANALTGTIPSDTFSPSLRNISLSHNHLSSTIPYSFQQGQLLTLDLSHNKLTGVWQRRRGDIILDLNLSDDVEIGDYASRFDVKLTVNRLSGDLPHPIKLINIDVLKGNLFGCGFPLPENDPSRDDYSCGSSQLDQSLYFLLGGFSLMLLTLIIYVGYRYSRHQVDAHWHNISDFKTTVDGSGENERTASIGTSCDTESAATVTESFAPFAKFLMIFSYCLPSVYLYMFFLYFLDNKRLPNIREFQKLMKKLALWACVLTLLGLFLTLPVFVLKLKEEGTDSFDYSTHTHTYG